MGNFLWTLNGTTISVDSSALVIITIIIALCYMMWDANKRGRLDWTDMIKSKPRKVSLTKLLQLVGGVTGTWIMITTTLHNNLTPELLMIYLTYVGAIEGWSKFITARYGVTDGTVDESTAARKGAAS